MTTSGMARMLNFLVGEGADNAVASSIETRLSYVPPLTSECCIYKVPMILREVNEAAYTPKLVSIGPFHRGTKRLQPMEVHKSRYVKDFLKERTGKTIEYYVANMRRLEERVRQCYDEPISLKSEEFVEMMIIDGIFIVEFMLKGSVERESNDSNDPIFSTSWMENILTDDMLLMENQLPFFVMEQLFSQINNSTQENQDWRFLDLACLYFSNYLRKDRVDSLRNSRYQVKHFVDLLQQCFTPSSSRIEPKSKGKIQFIPTATELHASGVKFRKGENSNCFLDINFTKSGIMKSGVMTIPHFSIEDGTEILFRNLIAFEHFNKGPSYVANYTEVMDCLINTPSDVALLRRFGIINNWLGDDENVSLLFNNICKGVVTSSRSFYYARLFEDVNAHYKQRRHRWRAKLSRGYFGTPWSTISFVAAAVLLACTIVQTVFVLISG